MGNCSSSLASGNSPETIDPTKPVSFRKLRSIDKDLINAINDQDLNKVNLTLEAGANPNCYYNSRIYDVFKSLNTSREDRAIASILSIRTPLNLATINENYQIAEALIQNGAIVDFPKNNPAISAPFMLACQNFNVDLMRLFAEHGADLNSRFDSYSPSPAEKLVARPNSNYNHALKVLVDAGAVIDFSEIFNWTINLAPYDTDGAFNLLDSLNNHQGDNVKNFSFPLYILGLIYTKQISLAENVIDKFNLYNNLDILKVVGDYGVTQLAEFILDKYYSENNSHEANYNDIQNALASGESNNSFNLEFAKTLIASTAIKWNHYNFLKNLIQDDYLKKQVVLFTTYQIFGGNELYNKIEKLESQSAYSENTGEASPEKSYEDDDSYSDNYYDSCYEEYDTHSSMGDEGYAYSYELEEC
jgi:hypothetical protein